MNRGEGEFEQSGEYKHSSTLQHRHTFQLATYTCRTCNWFQMKPLTLDIMTISTSWSLVKLVIWFIMAYMPSASRSATMGNLLLWLSSSPAPSSTQTLQQILSFPTCSLALPTLANHRLHVRLCYMYNGLLSFPSDVIRPRVTVTQYSFTLTHL